MRVRRELKPLRIPLNSKKTKRCPACRHSLIKPEQKAQSVRFKIKLVAANYIPAMTVAFPPRPDSIRQRGAGNKQAPAEDASSAGGLQAGGTNAFYPPPHHPPCVPIPRAVAVPAHRP